MLLNNYRDRNALLIDWMLDTIPAGSSFLDIGANDGSYCPQVARIAAHAGHFAGVDPDVAKLRRNPFVHAKFPATLEEADIPPRSFDCAYAIYVLEHVRHHVAFMEVVARVLKPGGSFFFITPNGNHYFAAIAGTLAKLGIQEHTHRLLRRQKMVADDYHYPALYKLNRPARLRKLGSRLGISCEFRYSENFGEVQMYFPRPLKVIPRLWERMAASLNADHLLLNLMGRMVVMQSDTTQSHR